MVRMLAILVVCSLVWGAAPVAAQGEGVVIRVLDRQGQEISSLVDGNTLQLSLSLAAAVSTPAEAAFFIDGLAQPVATCSLAAGAKTCTSAAFAATGWYWASAGTPQPQRTLHLKFGEREVPVSLMLGIRPRPVVMVHGFLSSWETWQAYLGPQGYLATLGLQGFAVGDGQVPGVLNTGSPSNPAGKTNSIAQNAEILGQYLSAVQQQTGAEKVDLLVHSMGGMISRYYLDRVMSNDNVAQVIFLGTPMAGSACVYPLASLGYLLPASLEILPDYMTNIFNQQIVHRHGIPFHMVAGTLLTDPLTSPCAAAPSDTVVALGSATSIALDDVQETPLYHGDLTADRQVFETNVRHLLQAPPGAFAPRPDLAAPSVTTQPEQFSRAYTGHLGPGETAEVVIDIEPNVSLANFNLYDSSRSLTIEVRGASGKLLELDTLRNGSLKIDDPATLLYLGYGFKQPKPGKWVVTLKTTAETPAAGANYALNARFIGGATLTAKSDPTIPELGQPVTIQASLEQAGTPLTVTLAQALVRQPDGNQVTLVLVPAGQVYRVAYTPQQPGLHGVEVSLLGQTAEGLSVDRAAYLTFEVQPGDNLIERARTMALLAGLGLIGFLVGIGLLVRFWRRRKTG